ncbi:putative nucleotide-binding alpha-beta plait domain-containing protein [Rosa chinensis]|uniref:Putative nucleotide-binding alpha-beta plait domain-containing protein n=1 Tax=Rosa chinensis TaxID=74649 RepID=A0A2P6R470_ROSCH|nr:uncharacterized protein LOC112197686 [Rosa chinensis]PRQ41214.1 putative nucleotide-binding alpha-beta plait domain-containing protein [Rosa chinensis]
MISTARLPPSSSSLFTTPSLSFSFKTQLRFASTSSLPTAIFKHNRFLSSVHLTRLRFPAVHAQKSRKFGLQSVRKKRKGGNKLLAMDDDSDEEDDDDGDVDGGDEELELDGEDDEGEGLLVPFGEMKKWLEKKPRGFGEGRVYDTPIEDQLLEEIQVETSTKLQNDAVKANLKPKKNTADEVVVPAGFRVRVTNLPKKKNVHRDLTAAFKLVPGLLSINPAVTGNKKTKDPICKGFAFVHFKTEKDAARFVETFSSQSITFGKVQKQIKCEVVTSPDSDVEQSKSAPRIAAPRLNALKPVTVNYTVRGPKPATDPATKTSTNKSTDSQLTVSASGDQKVDSELDNSSLDTLEETVSDEYDGSDVEILEPELEDFMENLKNSGDSLDAQLTAAFGNQKMDSDLDDVTLDTLDETTSDDEYDGPDVEILGPEPEDFKENLQTSTVSDLNGGDSSIIELTTESESSADSSSSKQLIAKSKEEKVPRKKQAVKGKEEGTPKKKKLTVKEKAPKVPKLVVSGSSKRLKVKEKAVLSDVFSKYGLNPALASNEDS